MAENKGILICGEVVDGKLAAITAELLGAGKKLSAELEQPLGALLIGKDIEEVAQETIGLGADRAYTIDGPAFLDSLPDLYVALIAAACEKLQPSVVILGQTDMGRDVAPRLAAKLKTTAVLDCVGLEIDPETRALLQTRPVYGGNATAVWVTESQPQIATLRPRSVMAAESDTSRTGEIEPLPIVVEDSAIKGKLVETVKTEVEGIKLEDAKVIVAGGGGIGGPEGFEKLRELASLLGGTVGVTRVPCDEGWLPLTMEIGQTGRIVGPDLYIAVGISGAPQHMAGCSGSKCIVTINKDPDANLFKESNFGIVGDYKQVMPAFIEKCRELLSS
ncbi:MAG: electron transfer flavoprotein subunit alpha/FixB family protein [Dehalococcoidia bacterium]|nr:electron transfer flavoprotein subunit alpha/FixB family protein [Dehalococcoidia bacterium]